MAGGSPLTGVIATAQPIDANFKATYELQDAQGNPEYAVEIGTPDMHPTAQSTWYVLLHNNATSNWDIVYTTTGIGATTFGYSVYYQTYQPASCPTGLPPIAADNIQLYDPATATFVSADVAASGASTDPIEPGTILGTANCFASDSSGGPTDVFTMVSPNNSWTVTDGKFIDFASDDWSTFANDYLRTGFQAQPTGISTGTVSKLRLRWKVATPNGQAIYGSPLIYRGTVYVATLSPAAVYDLSASDGHVVWSTPIRGEARTTPTIDPQAGLLFIGGRLFDGLTNSTLPSPLYAISTGTGAIAWTATLGITHVGPVVANGVVYIGTAGGDAPQCINGV